MLILDRPACRVDRRQTCLEKAARSAHPARRLNGSSGGRSPDPAADPPWLARADALPAGKHGLRRAALLSSCASLGRPLN